MMRMNLYGTIVTSVFFLSCSVLCAQVIPRTVEINATHSLASNQSMEMKALERICIREGFRMEPGSSLKLVLVTREEDQQKTKEEIVIYPNPTPGKIIIQGTFVSDELVIYDYNGNSVMRASLTGENPMLDISNLKVGQYFVKTSQSEAKRLIKN
jgi:hypothetical protein